MRYLLSEIASAKVYSTYGTFATGETVTIEIFKNGVSEPLTSNACSEIGVTGIFAFDLSNITTQPTAYSELYWLMSEATPKNESGLIVAGGYPELLTTALPAANICRITTSLFEIDGVCSVEADVLANQSTKANYIELPGTYHDGSRYYKIGKYAPNYDRANNLVYWDIPQNAVVNVKLTDFGISETGLTVPALSTVDLYTLLNP